MYLSLVTLKPLQKNITYGRKIHNNYETPIIINAQRYFAKITHSHGLREQKRVAYVSHVFRDNFDDNKECFVRTWE